MDHHGDREDLIEEVALKLITAYGFVLKALQGLPLAINVPGIVTSGYSAELKRDLVRALAVLTDIPMDPAYREEVRGLVIDWMAAYDYLTEVREQFTWWQIDFVVTQLYRVNRRWKKIEGMRETLD